MTKDPEAIGRVETLPIRVAFPKESQHFTRWLESHIDALSERLGMALTVVQREKAVGDFNVDLLCEDSDQRPVIIENQLERTDHDHLGKLLTYLVSLSGVQTIWQHAPDKSTASEYLTALAERLTEVEMVKSFGTTVNQMDVKEVCI